MLGLLLHGDIPDMLGLTVPKPVLFAMGKAETCFHYPDMQRGYRRLHRIYQAAGASPKTFFLAVTGGTGKRRGPSLNDGWLRSHF